MTAISTELKTHPLISSSHAAVGLGKNLFPLFARALDLAPDFFDDKVNTGHVCTWNSR